MVVIFAVVLDGGSPEIWSWLLKKEKRKKKIREKTLVKVSFFHFLLFARSRLVLFVFVIVCCYFCLLLLLFVVAFVRCLLFISVTKVSMNGFNSTRAMDILTLLPFSSRSRPVQFILIHLRRAGVVVGNTSHFHLPHQKLRSNESVEGGLCFSDVHFRLRLGRGCFLCWLFDSHPTRGTDG